mgnify:FL=1
MRITDMLLDITVYLLTLIKNLLLWVFNLLFQIGTSLYEKFQEITLPEKVIFLNIIGAFFAVVLPMAKFYIFESYSYTNNPLAVYLIGIAMIMFASVYFRGFYVLVIRVALNAYYLAWVIYLPMADKITKADPHTLTVGYYLNIIVPVVYILAALVSGLWRE